MPPSSNALWTRDLPLYVLLGTVSSLPILAALSPSSAARPGSIRFQLRDFVRTLAQAAGLAIGGTGALVLVGGAVLGGEKLYRQLRQWWTARQARRRAH
ncbi:hypothetical protein JCM8097_007838 [Rhodosporidiobolus ruineniae]